jgi:hypothetical protein
MTGIEAEICAGAVAAVLGAIADELEREGEASWPTSG